MANFCTDASDHPLPQSPCPPIVAGKSRVVATVCLGGVIRPELSTVAVSALKSISTVIVTVAVTFPNSAGSLWSAAVSTTALNYRVTGAVFVWACTMVTRS